MAAYDERARDQAARNLKPKSAGGKGQKVTLTRRSTGVYNPATGAVAITDSTQSGSGIELLYRDQDIDGTLIAAGDTKFMLSPLTTSGRTLATPEVGDTITIGGAVRPIKAVEAFAPAGLVIFINLQVGGGG